MTIKLIVRSKSSFAAIKLDDQGNYMSTRAIHAGDVGLAHIEKGGQWHVDFGDEYFVSLTTKQLFVSLMEADTSDFKFTIKL